MNFSRVFYLCGVLFSVLAYRDLNADIVEINPLITVSTNVIFVEDESASKKKAIAVDLTTSPGAIFETTNQYILPAGCYEFEVSAKISVLNDVISAPLIISVEITGGGGVNTTKVWDIFAFEEAQKYEVLKCPVFVKRNTRVRVKIKWERDFFFNPSTLHKYIATGQPKIDETFSDKGSDFILEDVRPIHSLKNPYFAIDSMRFVKKGDLYVATLDVDKVRYYENDKAEVKSEFVNLKAQERTITAHIELISDLDFIAYSNSTDVKLAPFSSTNLVWNMPPFNERNKWGNAVRCSISENGKIVDTKEEYFTVHNNIFAVMIAGRNLGQFTARITNLEYAVKIAEYNKQNYHNFIESGFWAPDEYGDFTPDSEFWYGGQGRYEGSKSGTKMMIEEGKKRGIGFVVYANIWGGDGPPAFELVRKSPDFGYPAEFNVEWFERWNFSDSRSRRLHVWPVTIINLSNENALKHHAKELVSTYKEIGWEAVRYDSHTISEEIAKAVKKVKSFVRGELPQFGFGYNSSVIVNNPALEDAFKEHCEGESLIMEEAIRKSGSNKASYEDFANRLLLFRKEVRKNNGHFVAIGMDECLPNDLIYQYILWLAGNTHPCYEWKNVVYNYKQFATRYAGIMWDLKVKPLDNANAIVGIDDKYALKLWRWQDFASKIELAGGRVQTIIHLINKPVASRLNDVPNNAVPLPIHKMPIKINIDPEKYKIKLWLLTAEPSMTQIEIPYEKHGSSISAVVPKIRFWSVLVADSIPL